MSAGDQPEEEFPVKGPFLGSASTLQNPVSLEGASKPLDQPFIINQDNDTPLKLKFNRSFEKVGQEPSIQVKSFDHRLALKPRRKLKAKKLCYSGSSKKRSMPSGSKSNSKGGYTRDLIASLYLSRVTPKKLNFSNKSVYSCITPS